jgi:hypothetical protein
LHDGSWIRRDAGRYAWRHPWQVTVGAEQGIPLAQPMPLQIANPAAFIAQKYGTIPAGFRSKA